MIGNNIKKLRVQQGMTQKNLADKLFVSAQAISRWENDEVEPSIGTIVELAKIFDVSVDEILGIGSKESVKETTDEDFKEEIKTELKETIKEEFQKEEQKREEIAKTQEPVRQFLAVCEQCNSPIYNSDEIVRTYNNKVICAKCKEKNEQR